MTGPHRHGRALDRNWQEEEIGFSGFLTLPSSVIAAWGLSLRGHQQVTLGNGSAVLLDVYAGAVIWDGRPPAVEVDACNTDPLVGMSLLDRYALDVEVRAGAAVTITALP